MMNMTNPSNPKARELFVAELYEGTLGAYHSKEEALEHVWAGDENLITCVVEYSALQEAERQIDALHQIVRDKNELIHTLESKELNLGVTPQSSRRY